MDIFIFATSVLGKAIVSPSGRRRCRVCDLAADANEQFPRVTDFICKWRSGELVRVSWQDVVQLAEDGVHVAAGAGDAFPLFERRPGEVLLVGDVLDKQVVDVNGAKLERVNDISLLNTDRDLRVVHADVGARGLMRRLGFLRAFDALTRWLFDYKTKDVFISWRYVQPLRGDLSKAPVALSVARRRLSSLHPADLADIIEDLPQPEREAVFNSLDVETAAETLEEVEDPELAIDLLEAVGEEKAGDIIEEMDPDEAADVLQEFDEEQAEQIIEAMEDGERADDLRELLTHEEGTAGAIMTTEYLAVCTEGTVGELLARFKTGAAEVEAIDYVYVVDGEERLRGVFSLREALASGGDANVGDLMDGRVIAVNLDDKLAAVADAFGKYRFAAVPVVDDDGKMHGVIMLHDAVAAIYPDFAKD